MSLTKVFSLLALGLPALSAPETRSARPISRAIAHCAWDGVEFSLRDAPNSTFVTDLDDVTVTARYLPGSDQHAVFTLKRAEKAFAEIDIPDLVNPNGWLAVAPNRKSFAITWSNAGAAGGWLARLFRFMPDGSLHENKSIMTTVRRDFALRHNCKTRGDNFEAIRWMDDKHILLAASVYGTSDCGKEAGYGEGYLVDFSSATVQRRLTEAQLVDLPMVCTWNTWQPPPLVNSTHARHGRALP